MVRTMTVLAALLGACAQAETGWLIRVRASQRTYAVHEDGTIAKELRQAAPSGDLSPAGDWVLEREPEGAEFRLFLADPDGKNRRSFVAGLPVSEARWAPDGRHVLFVSAATGRPQAYSAPTIGDAVTQLTRDEEGVRRPRQTVDGTLAYLALRGKKAAEGYAQLTLEERLARKGTLDRVDLIVARGGREKAVAKDTVVHDYAVSPDGGVVAYGTIGKLVVVELGTEVRREIPFARIDRRLTTHIIEALAWRPDGKALLFRTRFVGGRWKGTSDHAFGDRECFVFTLNTGRSWQFQVEPSALVEWIEREAS